MAKLKRMGLVPGVSDLVIIWFDKKLNILFLELKTKTGKQSENQKRFEESVVPYCNYELAHSFIEAKEAIEKYIS